MQWDPRTWHTAYALTNFFLFTYLLNKLNLRKELFTSDFSRFCWWAAHILDQCGAHLPDFWLLAPAPLCPKAVRANFAHAQNVRGTMIHQPTNDGSCRWTPHSLMSPVWSLRPARSQEGLSYSWPQLQFPSLFPSLSQFPAPWPALPNKQLVLQSLTLKSASRSQMKANKCIVHEYTSVHSGLEDHEFCFCCLPMYWLLHSASGGPLWWCRKNWVCYLSQ